MKTKYIFSEKSVYDRVYKKNRVYTVGQMMIAYADIQQLVKSVQSMFRLTCNIYLVNLPAGQLLPLGPAVA